jgi:hypothetical protein
MKDFDVLNGDGLAGRSARVEITLRVNGEILSVAQAGPEFLIVNQPRDVPPCSGDVVVTIDGRPHQQRVALPQGMSSGSPRVAISDCS